MKSSIVSVVDHENQGKYKTLRDLANEYWREDHT